MEAGFRYFIHRIFAIVVFQSCAAGVSNALEANDEMSGSIGIFVAIFMLAGGIVSIAVRNSEKNGGNIALVILFGLAAIIGFAGHGSYSDLVIWASWCLINVILAVLAMFVGKKKKDPAITEEKKDEEKA